MPNTKRRWDFKTRVAILFLDVYPLEGFRYKDHAPNKWNRFLNISHPTQNTSSFSVKTLIALGAFFGLPSSVGHDLNAREEEGLTQKRLFLNFVGWPDEHNPYMSTFRKNGLKIFTIVPLIGIYHLIWACLKTTWNTAKLVTEFFPGIAVLCSETGKNNIFSVPPEEEPNDLGTFVDWLSLVVYYLAKPISVLGTALTSPRKSAQLWYETGLKNNNGMHYEVLFSSISIGLSSMCYSLIFAIFFRMFALNNPELLPDIASSIYFSSEGNFAGVITVALAGEFSVSCLLGLVGSVIKCCLSSSTPEQHEQTIEEGVEMAHELNSPTSHPRALSLLIQHSPRHEGKKEEMGEFSPHPPKESASTVVPPPRVNKEAKEAKERGAPPRVVVFPEEADEGSIHSISIN